MYNFTHPKRLGIFEISCYYYLGNLLLPIFDFVFPVYFDVANLLMLVILTLRVKKVLIKFVIPIIPILFIQLIQAFLINDGFKDISLNLYNNIVSIFPLILSYYLISSNDVVLIRRIVNFIIVAVFITAITSINGLIAEPDAIKFMAGNISSSIDIRSYNIRNIGGFSFLYIVPIIIPMIFALYHNKILGSLKCFLIAGCLFYFIFISQFTIALLGGIISLSSFFLARDFSYRKNLIFIIFLLLITVFFRSFIGHIAYDFANMSIIDKEVAVRVNAIGDVILGLESTDDEYLLRQLAYDKSIGEFTKSILFGGFIDGVIKIGGHSFFLDTIAGFGLIGLLILIFTYAYFYKVFYMGFRKFNFFGYMNWAYFISIFFSALNPVSNFLAIGLIIPLVAYYIQYKKQVNIALEGYNFRE
jgi:hypothetical protein